LTLESFDSKKVILDIQIVQQRLSDLFHEFDQDGSQSITHDEFFSMLQSVQKKAKISQQDHFNDKKGIIFLAILDVLDTNKDGLIDEEEFTTWCIRGLQLQPHERISYRQQNEFSRKLGILLTGIARVVAIAETEVQQKEDPYHRAYHLAPIGASGNESDSMGELSDKSGSGVGVSSHTGTSEDEEDHIAGDGEGCRSSVPSRAPEEAAVEAAEWSMDFPTLISTEKTDHFMKGSSGGGNERNSAERTRSQRQNRRKWLSGNEKLSADESEHVLSVPKLLVSDYNFAHEDEGGETSGSATDYSQSDYSQCVIYSETSYSANSEDMADSELDAKEGSAGEDRF
jgi:hypothetical protein